MPVRWRSRVSICAMYRLPFWLRSRSSDRIGAGDFDVVAEHVVEAHLERGDAGALALAGLDLRDVPLAVLAEVAQFVELGMETGADGAAVHQVERRFVGDGFEDEVGDVGEFV